MRPIAITAAIMSAAAPVLASGGEETMGTGLLAILFLGFGALIITCQLAPALLLFFSMLKGFFGSVVKNSAPKTGTKAL